MGVVSKSRHFRLWLVGLTLVAFAVRLVYALPTGPPTFSAGDSFFYRGVAERLAEGDGFVAEHRPGGDPRARNRPGDADDW
jgi:hypothetical protein